MVNCVFNSKSKLLYHLTLKAYPLLQAFTQFPTFDARVVVTAALLLDDLLSLAG